jgi:hypothetical protein
MARERERGIRCPEFAPGDAVQETMRPPGVPNAMVGNGGMCRRRRGEGWCHPGGTPGRAQCWPAIPRLIPRADCLFFPDVRFRKPTIRSTLSCGGSRRDAVSIACDMTAFSPDAAFSWAWPHRTIQGRPESRCLSIQRTGTLSRKSGVFEQGHEAEVHVHLLMAMEERRTRIVGDEVELQFLEAS